MKKQVDGWQTTQNQYVASSSEVQEAILVIIATTETKRVTDFFVGLGKVLRQVSAPCGTGNMRRVFQVKGGMMPYPPLMQVHQLI